ncbi:MAG: hypothetical protein IJO29_03730 [Oscillospiraceae bacterium]|nr:hypothetical protein [Oscillospiraceae bacterium]
MTEVFSSPRIERNYIAQKMLVHVILALAALGVCVAMLFISIGRDSQANRDAIYKTTSSESEMWLVVTCLASIAAIFYISVIGFMLADKIRRQFSNWVYYNGRLYYVAAATAAGGLNIHKISRIIKAQDRIIMLLNDSDILIKIIKKEIKSDDICFTEIEEFDKIRKTNRGIKVWFGTKKAEIMKEVCGYERLTALIDEFAIE